MNTVPAGAAILLDFKRKGAVITGHRTTAQSARAKKIGVPPAREPYVDLAP